MKYEKHLKSVEKEFFKLGKPFSQAEQERFSERYFKGTRYKMYDIKNSQYKKLLKHPFKFTEFDQREISKVWSYIFKNTDYLEVGSLAIDYFKQFQNRKTYDLTEDWPLLKSWAPKIENWVHGDMLCGLYCDILSRQTKLVYPEIEKWGQSRNPWKIRLAILSLLYYYNQKRTLLSFKKYIDIIKPHIEHEHYYVQKAVGWALRELQKPYPEKAWNYIEKNNTKFSSVAFSTIVENTPEKKKAPIKEARKAFRKSKNKAKKTKS